MRTRGHYSTPYGYAIRSLPILFITGFIIALFGSITHRSWAEKLGVGLFLLGGAVWGFANGGAFVWGFLRTVRRYGFREFTAHPWSSALYILLMVSPVFFGACFLWIALRATVLSR